MRLRRNQTLLRGSSLGRELRWLRVSQSDVSEPPPFPYIVDVEEASQTGSGRPSAPFGTVRNPIRMMEMEHESAGDAMARIRSLTSGYAIPEGACTTYRVCFKELEAFESDLHAHVHLENNILFPKARALARPSFA